MEKQSQPDRSAEYFSKFQKLITSQLLKYRSVLNQERVQKVKPNFSGRFLIQRSEHTGFQQVSIEIYRMLLMAKVRTYKTVAQIKKQDPKSPLKSSEQSSIFSKSSPDPVNKQQIAKNNKPKFEIFFPEYMIELSSWIPKKSSIALISNHGPAQKVIKLTDIAGRTMMIRGETDKATLDLWHYAYNKGIQTVLPGYIKQKSTGSEAPNFGKLAEKEFFLINHQITQEFKLLEIPLSEGQAVVEASEKWLFDLNIDLVDKLGFERTSSLFIKNNKLVICKSFKKLEGGVFLNPSCLEYNPELFLKRLDGLLVILKNLQHRNVFLGADFDLGDIVFLGGRTYFRNVERLSIVPKRLKYTTKLLAVFLKKLTNLLRSTNQSNFKSYIKKDIATVFRAQDLFFKSDSMNTLGDLLTFFRNEINLVEHYKTPISNKSKKRKAFDKIGKKGQNTLNSLDVGLTTITESDANEDESEINTRSTFEVEDEGEVDIPMRATQRMRGITFKNAFRMHAKKK